MSFLHKDTKLSLEGRYLKWSHGTTRKLELVSHDRVESKWEAGKTVDEITAIDKETGEEKVFTANKNFMRAIAKLDDSLSAGSVINVVPVQQSFARPDGTEGVTFDFDVTLDVGSAPL